MNRTADPATVSKVAIIILLIVALYVMAADFLNFRQARSIDPVATIDILDWPQPWGGYGWRHLAHDAGRRWRLDPTAAEHLILRVAERYPLDSRQWLDLARINIAGNAQPERIDALLQIARAVQPNQRETLWDAAQIALQAGNPTLAEQHLTEWLRQRPGDTERALFIGARWIDTPEQLIERLLPEGREYLEAAMAMAGRLQDTALADAVWARLRPSPAVDDRVFLDYIELLLDTGQSRTAARLWADREPGCGGGLFNGGFDRELGESLGLNWRLNGLPAGVRVERDSHHFHLGPASLAIHFNGKENVNLSAPWLRIPVEPGQSYRLNGYWSAEGLTTRALPYLLLSAEGARLRQRIEIPASAFEWQSWSLEFTAPEQSPVVQLMLRRDPTQAFDRNIAGRLWLDELSLQLVSISSIDSIAGDD